MKCIICEQIHAIQDGDSDAVKASKERKMALHTMPLGSAGVGAKLCAEHMARGLEWAAHQWAKEQLPDSWKV